MPKRIVVAHYGGPETLQVVEEECVEPKSGEVRIRVLAAGVALPDVLAREGIHPETPNVPFTPGRKRMIPYSIQTLKSPAQPPICEQM
jgi:NADPH:quinone reductase-like Zn-dependent oxidoreductase